MQRGRYVRRLIAVNVKKTTKTHDSGDSLAIQYSVYIVVLSLNHCDSSNRSIQVLLRSTVSLATSRGCYQSNTVQVAVLSSISRDVIQLV